MSDFTKQQAKLAAASLPLLKRALILARMVGTHNANEFKGAEGDVLNIRRPGVLASRSEKITRDKSRSIQTDQIVESTVQVKLTDHVYSAVDITDAEATLDVESFGEQILNPQVLSVATGIDLMVRDALVTLPALKDSKGATVTIARNDDPELQGKAIRLAIPKLRKALNAKHVPQAGRFILVGSEVESFLIT
ncbi:hypothetical protein FFZ77_25815, partial [Streptomyces katsurahamanus]|nr:hypothetical protein [Streptomyces katsurahamanus]